MNETKAKSHFLPDHYKDIYKDWILFNRNAGNITLTLTNRMEKWMHKKVAADLQGFHQGQEVSTLEIGAGNLNHLPYDKISTIYDVIEPDKELLNTAMSRKRVRQFYTDISEIPFGFKYNRIISVAVLEHVLDLNALVKKASLHLNDSGTFRAGIPNEGGFLWEVGWRITTARTFRRKYGLDYSVMMNYEHVNSANEIIKIIKSHFSNVKLSWFGFGSKFSFYGFIEAKCKR